MDTNGHAFTPLTIEGKYFAWFVGSDPNSPFAVSSISLGQTGQVPVAAKSILFWAVNQGGMQVTFNGFILNFSAISSTANYTVYGADISAYAGQVGLLIFSAPPGAGGKLDNIQFSTAVITPEPSSLALVALGSLLLARRHRQNS
jgi:hypothetical protein